eukprot:12096948-Alexandrium_andersonii.AAC.1
MRIAHHPGAVAGSSQGLALAELGWICPPPKGAARQEGAALPPFLGGAGLREELVGSGRAPAA